MQINSKSVINYALLPGIIPRVRSLFFTGSTTLNYLIARILYTLRLLPATHPAFSPEYFRSGKKVSLWKIMGEAANNLQFNWANADQVIIFSSLVCGIAVLALFTLCLFFFATLGTAHALSWSSQIFQTTYPQKDIAFMMMDQVFGIPGLFGSEVGTLPAVYGPFPNNFQIAMQNLFGFYSMGIFIIAMVIFLYHVVDIVLQITQTGRVTRHLSDDNSEGGFSWLPLRYVLALGLLLPFGMGLNSAQWITLYVAKFGSGLATNAWVAFNVKSGPNPTGLAGDGLTALPSPPDNTGLIKKLLLAKSCYNMHLAASDMSIAGSHPDGQEGYYDINAYIVNGSDRRALFYSPRPGATTGASTYFMVDRDSYNTTASGVANFSVGDVFADVLKFTNMSDINIVFGYFDESNPERFRDYAGGVLPVCGAVTVPVTGINGPGLFAAEGYFYATIYTIFNVQRPGVTSESVEDLAEIAVMREYLRNSSRVREYLNDVASGSGFAGNPNCPYDSDNNGLDENGSSEDDLSLPEAMGECTQPVLPGFWKRFISYYCQKAFKGSTYAAYDFLADTTTSLTNVYFFSIDQGSDTTAHSALGLGDPFLLDSGLLERGWGGAGIWYNKLSEYNGALYAAVGAVPNITRLPLVMENIAAERKKGDSHNDSSDFCGNYNPRRAGSSEVDSGNQNSQFAAEEASTLYSLCQAVFENETISDTDTIDGSGNLQQGLSLISKETNPLLGAISSIFGQIKAFDMVANDKVTPMVQLSAIGRLLIDKSIFNLLVSFGSSFAGGMAHIAGGNGIAGADMMGDIGGALSKLFMMVAMLGLSAGVLLHYVVPFMPFLYFFFAVGRWVKTVFEAMIGVPLWALAHLRASGPGLPGDAAIGGYFLLLEILVRPIVTIFALEASFSIFSAMVSALNSIFLLVTSNVMGGMESTSNTFEQATIRSIADQFFMTLLYIVVVYIIGTGCFKLINLIPDSVFTRWSGFGANSFARAESTASARIVEQVANQIPVGVQSEISRVGQMANEAFYRPAKQWSMGKAAEREAEAKAAAAAAAAKKAAKDKNGGKEEQADKASGPGSSGGEAT